MLDQQMAHIWWMEGELQVQLDSQGTLGFVFFLNPTDWLLGLLSCSSLDAMQPQACRAAEKPLRQHLRQLYHKTGCDWAVLHGAAVGPIHGMKLDCYKQQKNSVCAPWSSWFNQKRQLSSTKHLYALLLWLCSSLAIGFAAAVLPSQVIKCSMTQPFVVYRLLEIVAICCNIIHLFVGHGIIIESTNWIPRTRSHILQTDINDPL